ncbi:hypothetical protein OROGR_023346 [Orobanche gracilis]
MILTSYVGRYFSKSLYFNCSALLEKHRPKFLSCRGTISSSCDLFDNRRSSIAIPSEGRFAPSLLIRSTPRVPILDIRTDYISTSTASRGRSRKIRLLCFSTAAEAHNSTAPTVQGNDDNTIREAANTLDIRVGKILKVGGMRRPILFMWRRWMLVSLSREPFAAALLNTFPFIFSRTVM